MNVWRTLDRWRADLRGDCGFSLVELLVVIAIISLLAGILYPALDRAKALGRGAKCKANLRAIGAGFRMYLNDSNDIFPAAAALPSENPNHLPLITELLQPHLPNQEVFCCPADTERNWYATDGTSYMYYCLKEGETIGEDRLSERLGEQYSPIMDDIDPFHGKPNTPGAKNYLFSDLHVGDFVD